MIESVKIFYMERNTCLSIDWCKIGVRFLCMQKHCPGAVVMAGSWCWLGEGFCDQQSRTTINQGVDVGGGVRPEEDTAVEVLDHPHPKKGKCRAGRYL